MRSILFIKLLFVTGLFSLNASASLIERDYLGVTGGVTYDTESQLEWLDLSFTRTMDFNEYQDYLLSLNDEWNFASSDLVANLFSNFDLNDEVNDDFGTAKVGNGYHYYSSPESAFINVVNSLVILGESMSEGSNFFGVKGFTSDNVGNGYEQYMAYYSNSQSIGVVALADYVRAPTGKGIQSFFTYRQSNAMAVSNVNGPSLPATAVPEPATLGLFAMLLSFMVFRRIKR